MLSPNSEAFLAVVELGSFTKAATHLGISTSQISRRVSQLEEQLETSLLRRTTRQIGLTETGEHYYQSLLAARDELREATLALQSAKDAPSGLLRVTSTTFLGHRLIEPIVAELLADFPELDVQLLFTTQPLDLVEERIDVAVRVEPFAAPTMIARKLMGTYLQLMASPGYLEANGTPQTLDELDSHDVIMWDAMRKAQTVYKQTVQKAGESVDIELRPRLTVSNASTLMRLVRQGRGIGPVPMPLVASEVDADELVPVLDAYQAYAVDVLAVYQERKYLLPSVRVFIDRLVEQARALERRASAVQRLAAE